MKASRYRLLKYTVLVIAIFSFFAIFMATQQVLRSSFMGRPLHWKQEYLSSLISWYGWALTVPLAIWLAKKYSFLQKRFWKAIVIIVIATLVVVIFRIFVNEVIDSFFRFGFSKKKVWPDWIVYSLISPRNFLDSIIFWAILAVVYSFQYYSILQEREIRSSHLETKLAQAQLNSLKLQLQPHFLFNTLNSISSLLREKGDFFRLKQNVGAADRMITNLSEMFRHTLKTKELQEIPLREELSFLDNYLEIEQIRFADRLMIHKSIDPKLDSVLVPSFFLQPLVENAIRHGIAQRTKEGILRILIRQRDNWIEFLVQDNGPCSAEELKQEAWKGIGMTNTLKRLEHLYGKAFSLELKKNSEGETELDLRIPVRNESMNSQDENESYD